MNERGEEKGEKDSDEMKTEENNGEEEKSGDE